MLESVDLFLKAVDKVIQLASIRKKNKREFFAQIVEPLFRELEPVIDDYYAFFSDSLSLLQEAGHGNIATVVVKVREMRGKHLLARLKVRELAKSLEESSRDEKIANFGASVCAIFEAAPHRPGRWKMSKSIEFLELFELVSENRISRTSLVRALKDSKDEIAIQWIAIVQSYGYLRLRSVQ